ncbi:hypothetical protein DAI22_05g183300 [Oryza sativa Japonica Group]|nr:hypothetical protein DAI22_05g183300 [Oryza sativa Japonica Group]
MAGGGRADDERRIGVAMDYSASSKRALDWAIANLLRRGDHLVVLHVLHHGGEEAKHALWGKSGSPLIPLSEFRDPTAMQQYGVHCDAEEQKIDTLVMGSRGLGSIQRILLGSVTNYVLSNASCPVTVVKGK